MNNTAVIALYAIHYGIEAAKQLVPLFQKDSPTIDDWNAVFALSSKSPDDYIAEARARLGQSS